MRPFRFLFASLLILISQSAFGATTLLPNGKQCFTTATGAVVSGSMNMLFVGTTTPKPTWQDSNQATLNTQPIQLDANGCAVLYGIGSYRQQLYSGPVVAGVPTGTLLWDQVTTDTSAYNAVFWAGISGGTPNVITVTDPGFNGTDGTVINFVALSTNTGSTTINPSGFGAINVVKDTASGPVSLGGGEIIQNNIISVVYSASANAFHLLNTAIATVAGNTQPFCSVSNLKVINSSITPNSIITITADQVLLQQPSGAVLARSNVTVNLNITSGTVTSTVNGMDGESPGVSGWLYIWLIDNGSGIGGLATLATGNGLTPNMPSGYLYKCRVGAMRVDGAGVLLRTTQRGKLAQYTITAATNTAAMPVIISGNSGSTAVPTWTSTSLAAFVPATASSVIAVLSDLNNGASAAMAAPNASYGALLSTTNPPPCSFNSTANSESRICRFLIETTNIFYAASGGNTAALEAFGWEDAVNAF